MTAVLGPKPPAQTLESRRLRRAHRRARRTLLVLNDEAHHTHDEDSEWNKIIRGLHAASAPAGSPRSSTSPPRRATARGSCSPGRSIDYPLKQAIIDDIVKRPLKGIATGHHGAALGHRQHAATRPTWPPASSAGRNTASSLRRSSKKPVLFVMMNDTDEADDVGDWLRKKYPDRVRRRQAAGHPHRPIGEVSKKDLDKARTGRPRGRRRRQPGQLHRQRADAARRLGRAERHGHRRPAALHAKANILPEQTIGRGLRLMFRDDGTGYTERVDVIGNKSSSSSSNSWNAKRTSKLETFEIGKDKLVIITIAPDPSKMDKDIAIPVLSPILTRKKTLAEEIAALDVSAFQVLPSCRASRTTPQRRTSATRATTSSRCRS